MKKTVQVELLIGDPVQATIMDAPESLKKLYNEKNLKLAHWKRGGVYKSDANGIPVVQLDKNLCVEVIPPKTVSKNSSKNVFVKSTEGLSKKPINSLIDKNLREMGTSEEEQKELLGKLLAAMPITEEEKKNLIATYLAKIGQKGGSSGRGESKKRGDSQYYRDMVIEREKKKAKSKSKIL